MDHWNFYTNGSGGVTSTDTDPVDCDFAAEVTLSDVGGNTQLYQTGVALTYGQEYTLQFNAKASASRSFRLYVHRHSSPYTNYGLSVDSVSVGTEWQTYNYTFTASGFSGSVSNGRLRFMLDTLSGGDTIWFDGVVLVPAGTALPTATPIPTATNTPIPTATNTPVPNTPTPSPTATPTPGAAVQIHTLTTKTSTSTNTSQFIHSNTSGGSDGSNRFMVVIVQGQTQQVGSDPFDITSVTWNGTPFTRYGAADAYSTNRNYTTEIWGLANPEVGSYLIQLTASQSVNDWIIGAINFTNVSRVDQVLYNSQGTGTSLVGSLTSEATGQMIVGGGGGRMDGGIISISPGIELYQDDTYSGTSNQDTRGQGWYHVPSTSGSQTYTMSRSSNFANTLVAIELEP